MDAYNNIIDKLHQIITTKEEIRQSISNKGQEIPSSTPFANYASKISNIETGYDV